MLLDGEASFTRDGGVGRRHPVAHRGHMHVGERPTGAANGVVVRGCLTIVANDAVGAPHLGDEPGVDEIVQRVVDGTVGDTRLLPAYTVEDLCGGRMVLPTSHDLEHGLALPCEASRGY